MAEDEKPDLLLEEAMDWLLRLQDSSRDRDTLQEFDVWLSRSPGHVRAWEKTRRTWQLMGEIPPAYEHLWKGEPEHRSEPRIVRPRRAVPRRAVQSRGWKRAAVGIAAAAAAAVLLVSVLPSILLRLEADYVTATAEIRTVHLADGSVVTLGAGSAIAADMSGDERRIKLLSGEALFDVAHNPSRPFIVDAAGVDVSVLGTVFNVNLVRDKTSVELAEGAVAISGDAARNGHITLKPGEMAVVDRRSGEISRGLIAPEDVAAWRDGRLFVNDATIGSVVEQLQRYHPAWITIPDGTLAAQRVTGLYDLRDPDRALRALVQPYGGNVREISPYVRIVSRL